MSNVPKTILDKKKFLKADGELKKVYKDRVDKYLLKFGKDNSVKKSNKPKSLFALLNTQKKVSQAIKDLEELKTLPNIPEITRDRFKQLEGQVSDFNANYLDQFINIGKRGLPSTSAPTGTLISKVPSTKPTKLVVPKFAQIKIGTIEEINKIKKKKDLLKAFTYAKNKKITKFVNGMN